MKDSPMFIKIMYVLAGTLLTAYFVQKSLSNMGLEQLLSIAQAIVSFLIVQYLISNIRKE